MEKNFLINTWTPLTFQDANSPVIEEFTFFHDHTIFFLIFFVRLVLYVILVTRINSFFNLDLLNNHFVETSWTVTPIICLVQIALPSLILLYVIEEFVECRINLKVTGHQWYWKYDYLEFFCNKYEGASGFDSFILPSNDLINERFRLLDVDNRAVIPVDRFVRILVTRADVIHSWALPTLGIKIDACPGRLNQLTFISHRPGIFYGQCSEICGANHRFIPIVLELTNNEYFFLWIFNQWEELYEGYSWNQNF